VAVADLFIGITITGPDPDELVEIR